MLIYANYGLKYEMMTTIPVNDINLNPRAYKGERGDATLAPATN